MAPIANVAARSQRLTRFCPGSDQSCISNTAVARSTATVAMTLLPPESRRIHSPRAAGQPETHDSQLGIMCLVSTVRALQHVELDDFWSEFAAVMGGPDGLMTY